MNDPAYQKLLLALDSIRLVLDANAGKRNAADLRLQSPGPAPITETQRAPPEKAEGIDPREDMRPS